MMILRAAGFAALCTWFTPFSLTAQDVTLTSRDGSIAVEGQLIGYDGEFYRVDTEFGTLTLDGSGVICDGPGCPDLAGFVTEFSISGSRTMGEVLVPALLEAFAGRNAYRVARQIRDDTHFTYVLTDTSLDRIAARINFRVTSSAEGFADLVAAEADIVLSTRQATPVETALAREAGVGDLSVARRNRIIALDALVPVVSNANPMRAIGLDQLAQIFAGEVQNWADFTEKDAPIVLHIRDDLSGLMAEFQRRVLDPRGLRLAEETIQHASDQQVVDAVTRDPNAIGVTVFSEVGNARVLDLTGSCGKIARPSANAIQTEDYPLTAPLFVYTPARRLPLLAREFLNFTRSLPGQAVVARAGFVDLRLRQVPLDGQGQRLANAIRAAGQDIDLQELQRLVAGMEGTARLTLSFRFEPGGTQLDPQSLSNVEILATELERGRFDNKRVVFVGFTDGNGSQQVNLRLARRRAESVRRAVLRAAPAADRDRLDIHVEAFGETMPLACDDDDWGAQINRRVEVWINQP